MSDRELVTIDPTQFNALMSRVDGLATRIGPANSDLNIHQVLTHIERTLHEGFRLIAASMSGGGDNSQVLNAINNLTSLVKENFMGLKEDNEVLTGKMGDIENAAQLIADDVTALKNELKEANERANIDLSPLVTRAENIASRLTGIAGPNAGSDPDAAPVEPPAEGGDTGGTNG